MFQAKWSLPDPPCTVCPLPPCCEPVSDLSCLSIPGLVQLKKSSRPYVPDDPILGCIPCSPGMPLYDCIINTGMGQVQELVQFGANSAQCEKQPNMAWRRGTIATTFRRTDDTDRATWFTAGPDVKPAQCCKPNNCCPCVKGCRQCIDCCGDCALCASCGGSCDILKSCGFCGACGAPSCVSASVCRCGDIKTSCEKLCKCNCCDKCCKEIDCCGSEVVPAQYWMRLTNGDAAIGEGRADAERPLLTKTTLGDMKCHDRMEMFPKVTWDRVGVREGCCNFCGPETPKFSGKGTLEIRFRPGASDIEKIEQIYAAMTTDFLTFSQMYSMTEQATGSAAIPLDLFYAPGMRSLLFYDPLASNMYPFTDAAAIAAAVQAVRDAAKKAEEASRTKTEGCCGGLEALPNTKDPTCCGFERIHITGEHPTFIIEYDPVDGGGGSSGKDDGMATTLLSADTTGHMSAVPPGPGQPQAGMPYGAVAQGGGEGTQTSSGKVFPPPVAGDGGAGQ